jgi:very-short-patch-repair endonuclease
MAEKSANPNLVVAAIARKQHGVVSIWQLRSAGLSDDVVLGRVRAGWLHRIHRGVYAVGYPSLSRESEWMAAVLVYGRGAGTEGKNRQGSVEGGMPSTAAGGGGPILDRWGVALSHRSAAGLWAMLPPDDGPVEVSVAGGGGRRRRKGIRVHRYRSLLPADVTLHRGIPVTKPARTVSDLRRGSSKGGRQRVVTSKELRRALRQASVLGLSIDPEDDLDRTRSELERDFLRLCRRHDLPPPEVNVRIGSHLVDFLWPEHRLVVETDGYRYHRGRVAFEDDRARDLDLRAMGYEVVRLSFRQVMDEPRRVALLLNRLIAAR